jgi:crotonobetainyl-CoA hydratase
MLLTGRPMSAQEALTWGLVNAVVPGSELLAKARALAQEIAQGAPLALAAVKEVMRETEGLDLPAAYAHLRSGRLAAYERMLTSEDAQEGPRAFAEKRPPVWRSR